MAIRLSDKLAEAIWEHARRDYPYECCGVLLGTVEGETKHVSALRPMPNAHEEGHERRYLIAPEEMFRLERETRDAGLQILGFYHSHPDHPAQPSEYDREWAWPWYTYIIVSIHTGEPGDMTCWSLRDDRSAFESEERLT
jgi:proteasome lid subunit RPN8/RPN11